MKLRTTNKIKLGVSIYCLIGAVIGAITSSFPWNIVQCGVAFLAGLSAWYYFDTLNREIGGDKNVKAIQT